MGKKNYFKNESVAQIKSKYLQFPKQGLVKKILDLDEELNSLIIPPLVNNSPSQSYKYGFYLPLDKPKDELPLELITNKLNELSKLDEDEIFWLGYKITPIKGKDKTPRLTSFNTLLEGIDLFKYSQLLKSKFSEEEFKKTQGIHVVKEYSLVNTDKNGASVIVKVPSTTKNKSRYTINFSKIPISKKAHKHLPFSLKTDFISNNPEITNYDELRFPFTDIKDVYMTDFHEVAAYLAVCNHFAKTTLIPTRSSPFLTFSKEAKKFHDKLNNNLLVYDETSDNYRHLYRAEKSILLSRLIKTFGVDNSLRNKQRDGPLINY
ncbi:MAG: hypothetical protein ACMXX9_00295 [Candidatus Woesearchaeota archaeon]